MDGPSGSGKTVFATALADLLRRDGDRVELFSTDLLATWSDPFGWWGRFRAGVLAPLQRGEPGSVVVHEWVAGQPVRGPVRTVVPADVLIVEGVSSGRGDAAGLLSALVWVEVQPEAARLERSVARDGEAERPQLREWQRSERKHFATEGTSDRADLRIHPQ